MKPVYRGFIVAALQCALVLSVAGKYALDRETLPRVWARARPYDPNLPIRGRYVSLRLEAEAPPDVATGWIQARLSAENGRLTVTPDPRGGQSVSYQTGAGWTLAEPVAFFISEHVDDPSRRLEGEELWVEVSVPKKGPPRPVRLGVKRDGAIKPLDLN